MGWEVLSFEYEVPIGLPLPVPPCGVPPHSLLNSLAASGNAYVNDSDRHN
jgi:hypothetical protein